MLTLSAFSWLFLFDALGVLQKDKKSTNSERERDPFVNCDVERLQLVRDVNAAIDELFPKNNEMQNENSHIEIFVKKSSLIENKFSFFSPQ